VSIELVLFFLFVKTAGENPMRVYRTCSVFFIAGENFQRNFWREYKLTIFEIKKKVIE
jgi:hypothetical protein